MKINSIKNFNFIFVLMCLISTSIFAQRPSTDNPTGNKGSNFDSTVIKDILKFILRSPSDLSIMNNWKNSSQKSLTLQLQGSVIKHWQFVPGDKGNSAGPTSGHNLIPYKITAQQDSAGNTVYAFEVSAYKIRDASSAEYNNILDGYVFSMIESLKVLTFYMDQTGFDDLTMNRLDVDGLVTKGFDFAELHLAFPVVNNKGIRIDVNTGGRIGIADSSITLTDENNISKIVSLSKKSEVDDYHGYYNLIETSGGASQLSTSFDAGITFTFQTKKLVRFELGAKYFNNFLQGKPQLNPTQLDEIRPILENYEINTTRLNQYNRLNSNLTFEQWWSNTFPNEAIPTEFGFAPVQIPQSVKSSLQASGFDLGFSFSFPIQNKAGRITLLGNYVLGKQNVNLPNHPDFSALTPLKRASVGVIYTGGLFNGWKK